VDKTVAALAARRTVQSGSDAGLRFLNTLTWPLGAAVAVIVALICPDRVYGLDRLLAGQGQREP
jgi:hypothetical protein